MSTLNATQCSKLLQEFKFSELFIAGLGWSNPPSKTAFQVSAKSKHAAPTNFTCLPIAALGGAVVLEVTAPGNDQSLPDAQTRRAVQAEIEKRHFEHVIIFVADARRQSLWYWVKRDAAPTPGGKATRTPRDHYYFKGQPGDLHLSKLAAMNVDIGELDENGDLAITEVARKLKQALDVERVTKRFFDEFDGQRVAFLEYLTDIKDEHDRRWYASVLLNRLMFVYFLQRKGFVNKGDRDYLRNKFTASKSRGKDVFFAGFLRPLFFEGFAKPAEDRTSETNALLGDVVYLNGGLFLPHKIEVQYGSGDDPASRVRIKDAAFENVLSLFERYSWNLDDTPEGEANEINPDVLGYIFEKYINQKEFGAYYTRTEITEYLCEQTIHALILDAVNTPSDIELPPPLRKYSFASLPELLSKLDAPLCNQLLNHTLPGLSLLDPACGSGAFLVAALKTLVNIYSAIIGKAETLNDLALKQWLDGIRKGGRSVPYFIKKQIITNNLFGVDIMDEAVEIARLRLFLALVASVQTAEQLEPLPNIDFNLLAGNSLIGLLRVDEAAYNQAQRDPAQAGLGIAAQQLGLEMTTVAKDFRQIVNEKNALVELYRKATSKDLRALRQSIDEHRREAYGVMNELLLEDMQKLGVQFEQATWDDKKNTEGKPQKRALTLADVEALTPFHWGYDFDEVMNTRGGFDAIITNPPWEIFKPQAKEFFARHSDLVTKNAMTIKAFEKEQAALLKNKVVRDAWLNYQSQFPHVSAYVRSAPQFANQISIVNGKKTGSDINLYKLFTEQCYNLLRTGGLCGTVIPSGIYTDLGAKQLRELLFGSTQVRGLFCFENRKSIFEGVDSRFKFVALSFAKGGSTTEFPAAFMRHEVSELQRFPSEGALTISVPLVRRLSPDSLSIMEFKSAQDVQIAEKMLRFPLLGEKIEGVWNLKLNNEFHMTNDSGLFKTQPGKNRLPLYEGKMIHQFDANFAEPRYWVDETEGRQALLGRGVKDIGQELDYERYRLGFRRIARNTDERSLIGTLLPINSFGAESFHLLTNDCLNLLEQLFLCAILNSFSLDALVRQKTSANINQFVVYQLPIPRLTARDAAFAPIASRAAQLVCFGESGLHPEFAALWHALPKTLTASAPQRGLDTVARARLRAELDGLVAHLYGLTEAEFVHVLAAFPLVGEPVKIAAQNAYRDFAPLPEVQQVAKLIQQGEGPRTEFKVAAFRNPHTGTKDPNMLPNITRALAALLNSAGGELLLGVGDSGAIVGIDEDVKIAEPKSPTLDKYELALRNNFVQKLGASVAATCVITFPMVQGKTLCRIVAPASPAPVYVDDRLYIRNGNQTLDVPAQEALKYVAGHWKK